MEKFGKERKQEMKNIHNYCDICEPCVNTKGIWKHSLINENKGFRRIALGVLHGKLVCIHGKKIVATTDINFCPECGRMLKERPADIEVTQPEAYVARVSLKEAISTLYDMQDRCIEEKNSSTSISARLLASIVIRLEHVWRKIGGDLAFIKPPVHFSQHISEGDDGDAGYRK